MGGSSGGALRIRRDLSRNAIGKKILAIPVHAGARGSIGRLIEIRNHDIAERVKLRWWQSGELDPDRWRELHALVSDRIRDARESLTVSLARGIRAAKAKVGMDARSRRAELDSIREEVWSYFDAGELDAAQENFLLELIDDSAPAEAAVSK